MSPRRFTSARARLLRLGELGSFFEGSHAMQVFGWTSKTAAHYLWSWARQGLVKPLGGKSDVFFNLVADPRAGDHLEAAIRRVMPGVVVGALNILHAAGITTQRPGMLQLLARPKERRVSIDGCVVEGRSPTWWAVIDRERAIAPGTEEALARLLPGAAVADSAVGRALAPDDLDLAELSAAERRRAVRLLGLLAAGAHSRRLEDTYRRVWELHEPDDARLSDRQLEDIRKLEPLGRMKGTRRLF